jgi:mRNA interferase RelE/StbE
MSYQVILKRSAQKELDHLPQTTHERVINALVSLKNNPRPVGIKKLRGREGYRLRIGDYRILYLVNDYEKEVAIYEIAHRKEVYR